MSLTSEAGTVAIPILTLLSALPSAPSALPGATLRVSSWRCWSFNWGAAAGSVTLMVVDWVLLTLCSELVGTRGR